MKSYKDNIFKILQDKYAYLKEKYSFSEFTELEYNNILNNSFEKAILLSESEGDFEILFKTELIAAISSYTLNKVSNSVKIVVNFINAILVDDELTIINFQRIGQMFNVINFIPSREYLNDLILESNHLKKLLKNIIKNKADITQFDVLSLNIIDIYLDMNGEQKQEVFIDCDKKLLSATEERELLEKALGGDKEARDTLIIKNQGLINIFIKRYPFYFHEDLRQVGIFGLIKAIDKFDLSKNVRFCAYAKYWVKLEIDREMQNTGKVIRYPVHVQENMNKILRKQAELINYDKDITQEEIADILNIKMTKALKDALRNNQDLNIDIYDADGELINEFLFVSPDNVEESFIEKDLKDIILNMIDKLSTNKSDRQIMILRYGLLDGKPKTFLEISERVNLSWQRCHQLHNRFIERVARSSYYYSLLQYANNPDQKNKKSKTV